MPGFDGTGPRGAGPLTGGGRGYCAVSLPNARTGALPRGYAGLSGWPFSGLYPRRWLGRFSGLGRGRGRGRGWSRW